MTRGWLNAGVLMMAALGLALGASQRTPSLVMSSADPALEALEARVARSPRDVGAAMNLARELLDRGAPGLALSVLERSEEAAGASPEASNLTAAALVAAGKNQRALAATRRALQLCEATGCEGRLVAQATRREGMLEAVLAAGIEDIAADPEATAAAYRRSLRQVRVAMN